MTVEQSLLKVKDLLNRPTSYLLPPEVCTNLLAGLEAVSTASELAAIVSEHLPELFTAYRCELIDTLKDTLSPTVWQDQGVLFNALRIPKDGPEKLMAFYDGAYHVEQNVAKEVTYYGDPFLMVNAGVAHVMDSMHEVLVDKQAKADVHGQTVARAYHQAEVTYYDRSCGSAYHSSVVHLRDRSFVDVGHDKVTVYAQDQSQFIGEYGHPTIYMSGFAQGYLDMDCYPARPVQVYLSDNTLLYAHGLRERDIQIHQKGHKTTIIQDGLLGSKDVLLKQLIIPRVFELSKPEQRLRAPLPLERLLTVVAGLLPADRFPLLQQATDETAVCRLIADLLPALAEQGVDGDFLRANFTEGALDACLIHAFTCPTISPNLNDPGTHHFFGEQLVIADRYTGGVECYEKTRVLSRFKTDGVQLHQHASGIAMEMGQLKAAGTGQVLAVDGAKVRVAGSVEATLFGHSQAEAFDVATVQGFEQSVVKATDQTSVYLCHDAQAKVDGHSRVCIAGRNSVEADGYAVIEYRPDDRFVQPTIKRLSDTVQVCRLSTGMVKRPLLLSQDQPEEAKNRSGIKR